MDRRRLVLAVVPALICLGLAVSPAGAFDFTEMEKRVTDFTLDNGMKFIVLEDSSVPVVSFVIGTDAGGVNDPKERTGLSHLFEHLAFKGTSEIGTKDYKAEKKAMAILDSLYIQLRAELDKGAKADTAAMATLKEKIKTAQAACDSLVAENEFSNIIEEEGGTGLNAGTGYDNTSYYYSFPSNRLELWFYLESSRFSDPVFRDFYKERDVIREERRMRIESSPIGRLVDEFLHAAFRAHPYGYALVGQASEIENFTPVAAMEFFRKYYVPSNMTAAIVGDVNPAEAKKLAMKYFGSLPKVPKPRGPAIVEPEQKAERIVIVPDKAQPTLLMGYHRPEANTSDDAVFGAIAGYLGGGRTSLLYKNLVKEKKLATNAAAFGNFPGFKYPNLFGIYVVPAKGITAEKCMDEVLAEVEKVKNEPIPPEELEKIKAQAKADMVRNMASRSGLANLLINAQFVYGDWRMVFTALDRINAVTAADIQRVANTYFTRSNRTEAYIETAEE